MSLTWLMRLVAFFAVSSAALAKPSAFWMALTVSAMLVLLIMATVNAMIGKDRSRRFEIGFATSGWIYIVLLLGGFEHTMITTWASQTCHGMLHNNKAKTPYDTTMATYYTGVWTVQPQSQIQFLSMSEQKSANEGGRMGGGIDPFAGGGGGYGGGYGAGYGSGGGGGGYSGYGGAPGLMKVEAPVLSPFARYMHVTHCMWAVLFGTLIGMLAVRGGKKESATATEKH